MLAALWGFSLWAKGRLPARVPIHWDLAGQVNGWGSPLLASTLLPAIATGTYLLILAYDWGGMDFKAARAMSASTTRHMRLLILFLTGGLHGLLLQTILQGGSPSSAWMLIIISVFLVLLGNIAPRLEPNAWVGLRIPPTLEHREVWKRTHRVFGRWLVVAGLLGVPASLLPEPFTTGLIPVLVLLPVLGAVIHAYWIRHRLQGGGIHVPEVP